MSRRNGGATWLTRAIRLAGPALLAMAWVPAEANSVQVARDAALGGSQSGLKVHLDDPAKAPATEAWVAVGSAAGLEAEAAIRGAFLVDPGRLSMSPRAGRNHLQFLRFLQDGTPASPRLALALERDAAGKWYLSASVWDDTRSAFVPGGRAFLCGPAPSPTQARVHFEWGAASEPGAADGYLRVFRAAAGRAGRKILLFERYDLDNGTQRLSHMQAGVVDAAHHFAGTSGDLHLDDFSLYRVFERPVPTNLATVE